MEKILTPGPFVAKLSFRYLKEAYEALLTSENPTDRFQAQQVLELFDEYPVLYEGITSCEDFEEHKYLVGKLMSYLFPPALRSNEIKAASDPLSNFIFYKSSRFEQILNHSNNQGSDVLKKVFKDHIQGYDLIPYAIILNSYYQYDIDFDRPKNLKVTDKHGLEKTIASHLMLIL